MNLQTDALPRLMTGDPRQSPAAHKYRSRRGCFMNNAAQCSKAAFNEFRWIVDFRIRPSDRRQALMINAVGPTMFERLAEVWLEAIAPESHDLEEESTATRRIAFRARAVGRKFVHVWGGRLGRLDSSDPRYRDD
jgi:hypothetical protein